MTFDDAKKLLDAGAPESIDEAAELLSVLTETRRYSGVYIAIALYESRKLYTAGRWSKWAMERWRFSDEKKAFHRANVGEMLRAAEGKPALHGRFMELGITVLETWVKLFNEGKNLVAEKKIEEPLAVVVNFLKTCPDAFDLTRDRLDRKIAEFLHPDQGFAQLELRFDALGSALEDEQLDKLICREDFGSGAAFTMAYNGAKLADHAARVIERSGDDLPAEALKQILDNLDGAARKLRAAIAAKRSRGE